MKTPKHKINVAEICAALDKCGMKVTPRKTLYRSEAVHGVLDGITYRPARGQCYEENITSFTLYVGATYGGHRVNCYHSEKIEGANWKDALPAAVARTIQKAKEYAAIEKARRDAHFEARNARIAYAETISKAMPGGKQIEEWELLTGEGKMPVGYVFKIRMVGPATLVAADLRRIQELLKPKA